MLNIIQAVFLGVVQGITEWLPVSSSGHLAIVQHYMGANGRGLQVPVAFDVLLHFATLLVLLVFIRKEVIEILAAAVRRDFGSPSGRMFIFIIIAGIPTAIIGLTFRQAFGSMFTNMAAVGGALIVTGAILLLSRYGYGRGDGSVNRKLGYGIAFLIGAAQGIAVAPGISRSGATIGIGLFAGLKREQAIRFSLLLAMPTIIAATLLEAENLAMSGIGMPALAAGFATSLVAGYISLRLLIKLVMQKKFSWFAVYCFVVGALLITSMIILA